MKKKEHNFKLHVSVSAFIIMTSGYCADRARIDPDYSKPDTWLTLPASTYKPVDVLWVYPTVYTGNLCSEPT
jgi:hypothetical protein